MSSDNNKRLEIKDLHVRLSKTNDGQEKQILKGVTVTVPPGEVHAIMGPNGCGKTTLSYVLAGKDDYKITSGSIKYKGQNLPKLTPDERAALGIFLAFQSPIELSGVNNVLFLRTAVNSVLRARDEDELNMPNFLKLARSEAARLQIPLDMLKRNVNVGFSGGEKKRNEVLQMALLKPSLAILDEIDSGLDIDALKVVAEGVNSLRSSHFSTLVITHHKRLLEYLVPDRIHIMVDGRIVHSGGPELSQILETEGYSRFLGEAA